MEAPSVERRDLKKAKGKRAALIAFSRLKDQFHIFAF
jgi:hypothetical protein